MNKKSLLILPISFLLCSCTINFFKKTTNKTEETTHVPGEVIVIPDTGAEEMTKHATKVSPDPKAPFYLKVGETRRIGVSFDQTPEKAEEKTFTWSLQGNHITYALLESSPTKIDITGVSAGSCVLTATNNYNESLVAKFYINVIEFDEQTDYLWQYASSDRAQFGYTTDLKEGTTTGTAKLNGMDWAYERSKAVSLNTSQSGYLGFGKGSDPETHLHFETENARTVNSISIEATSANALAKMTVKVGDTIYLNEVEVPKLTDDVMALKNGAIAAATGKIEIDVVTPEYDKTQAENPDYKKPGGFFIKSILIDFEEALPNKSMALVDDESGILEGEQYIIIGHSDKGYGLLNGTLSSSVKDNPYIFSEHVSEYSFMETFDLEASVSVPADFDKFAFTASFDDSDKLNFTSSGGIKIGLANSGTLSTTASPALLGWDYSIDSSNHLLMSMLDAEETPKLRHFGANATSGKFSSYANATNNVYLYKI